MSNAMSWRCVVIATFVCAAGCAPTERLAAGAAERESARLMQAIGGRHAPASPAVDGLGQYERDSWPTPPASLPRVDGLSYLRHDEFRYVTPFDGVTFPYFIGGVESMVVWNRRSAFQPARDSKLQFILDPAMLRLEIQPHRNRYELFNSRDEYVERRFDFPRYVPPRLGQTFIIGPNDLPKPRWPAE